jgi:signal transduction histidine kinase
VSVQAERAAQIIHRLRNFMAREDVRTVPVDANVLATEVLDLCRAEASQCGVQLQLRLHAGLPALRVDKIQIEQVVLNLARNGIESMHQAQCEPRVLVVETQARDGEVWITVRDTGPGVPAEAVPRIFDAFFTTKPGGMGVGLAISRSIAEAHGGRLWLEAPPGAPGACFHLALPAQA